MNTLPKPASGTGSNASRLPAPTPTSKLRSAGSAAAAAARGAGKRGASPSPCADKPFAAPSATTATKGNAAKKPRAAPTTGASSNLNKGATFSKSMMQLPGSEGFGSRFAPITATTGRASTIVPRRGGGATGTTAASEARTRATLGKTTSVRVGERGSNTSTRSSTMTTTSSRSVMNDKTNTSGDKDKIKVPKAPKRQPWDLKGRLEDMESYLRTTQERLGALENQNTELQSNVEEKETVVQQNTEELDSLRAHIDSLRKAKDDLQRQLDLEADKVKAKNREIEDLQYAKSSLDRRIQGLEGEVATKISEVNGLKSTVAEVTSASAGLEAKLTATKVQLEEALTKVSGLEKLSSDQAETLELYKQKERSYETERRKLHNAIQELKGNIRVFCRVRPLLGDQETRGGDLQRPRHLTFSGDKALEITRAADSPNGASTSVSGKAETFQFDFDHVFDMGASQGQVFEEVSQLVQSAIDGYNVCIFAYGQTGSGKTFTMEGGEEAGQQGIIPRTIAQIFESTRDLVDKGWSYKMEASFVEIYNEEIRDLLATEKGLKYDIKRIDPKSTEIYVTNLKVEDVTSDVGGDLIERLLRRAKKNRAVAATNCNERSSRSHSVFILKIHGKNSKTQESCVGSLNLVDLAGSERLKSSGSTGMRLEETKNINSSLSNLSKVILALANSKDGSSHIPYRDSKLTHLLMNSLGGNSKTLMFVNLNPREEFFSESLNSLRFAKRVNQCQIGTASKKVTDLK